MTLSTHSCSSTTDTPLPVKVILAPALNPGERLVFTITTRANIPGWHIILLPGEAPSASQVDQIAWARGLGAGCDLPTLAEQALMREHCPDEFRPVAYWSNRNGGDGWAWYTLFDHGHQGHFPQNNKLPARAVRRISF